MLTNIEQRVKDTYNGQNTQQTSVLRKMIIILESINKDSDVLKDRFSEFKDNISAMATWINDMRKQPLELDYIVISSPESELPKANVGFFESLWHEIKAFIASFYEDYDNIGSMTEEQEKEAVVVWIETGAGQAGNRDNANVLKELINTSFTKETGIPISLPACCRRRTASVCACRKRAGCLFVQRLKRSGQLCASRSRCEFE